MCVVISCIEVPLGADAVVEAPGARVHRALAAESRFRYISVGASAPTVRPVGADAAALATLAGKYEICHSNEQAAVPYADDNGAPVVFINCMQVTPGEEETAFEAWQRVNAYMVTKPGYQWHKLHLRMHDDAPFGLINVVGWQSAEAWRAAHDEGFRALTAGPLPFVAMPTLCELVQDNRMQDVDAS